MEIIKTWVEKLESGDYKQGTGYLRRQNNTFCCLGVLCDIVDPKAWQKPEDGRYIYKREVDKKGYFGVLPEMLAFSTGVSPADMDKLTKMNDKDRKTFPEIAQWIRERYLNRRES